MSHAVVDIDVTDCAVVRVEKSALSNVITRYGAFFALFGKFDGYVNFFLLQDHVVNFFLLQDHVNPDGTVRFYLPFESYDQKPLPATFEEYVTYRNAQLELLAGRMKRIEEYASTLPS